MPDRSITENLAVFLCWQDTAEMGIRELSFLNSHRWMTEEGRRTGGNHQDYIRTLTDAPPG